MAMGNPVNSGTSLWSLPGLDKNTFYAAALYLHAARGSLHGRQSANQTIKTPVPTRDFLDQFADVFAASRRRDAPDHVTATAMVRNEDEKTITIYIAKNRSEKGFKPFASPDKLKAKDFTNKEFAGGLIDWFNHLTRVAQYKGNRRKEDECIFRMMCKFNWSRLEFYNKRLSKHDKGSVERAGDLMGLKFEKLSRDDNYKTAWREAATFVDKCRDYEEISRSKSDDERVFDRLVLHVQEAGRIRKLDHFRALTDIVEALPHSQRADLKKSAQIIKWINYLARLSTIHLTFQTYCEDNKQAGYTFHYELLPSQTDVWLGPQYKQIVRGWAGNLDLDETRETRSEKDESQSMSVGSIMDKVAGSSKGEAPIHCEMQLLMHFLQAPEKCLDYFGCSKKSCWLCWQLMVQHRQFNMKGTHCKLYPRWAFPFSFSEANRFVAEGIRAAYNDMLFLIQEKAITQKTLDALDPVLETSARLTPAHRRFSGADNVRPDLKLGPFFENPVTIPGRISERALPALHLPMNISTKRQVNVDTYQKLEEDPAEDIILPTRTNTTEIVLAFQLITKLKSESLVSEEELRESIWLRKMYGSYDEFPKWAMYYRADMAMLHPNPWILKAWQDQHGHEYKSFPWRGDVFIFKLRPDVNVCLESDLSDVDDVAALKDLKWLFEYSGPDHAAQQRQEDLEILNNLGLFYRTLSFREMRDRFLNNDIFDRSSHNRAFLQKANEDSSKSRSLLSHHRLRVREQAFMPSGSSDFKLSAEIVARPDPR